MGRGLFNEMVSARAEDKDGDKNVERFYIEKYDLLVEKSQTYIIIRTFRDLMRENKNLIILTNTF